MSSLRKPCALQASLAAATYDIGCGCSANSEVRLKNTRRAPPTQPTLADTDVHVVVVVDQPHDDVLRPVQVPEVRADEDLLRAGFHEQVEQLLRALLVDL